MKALNAWKSWKTSKKVTVSCALLAAACLTVLSWSPAPITMAWQDEMLQRVNQNGIINLVDLIQLYIQQLPVIWLRIGMFWVKSGLWMVGVGFILTTMAALGALMIWDPEELHFD